jgi:transcriptional regulator with XRE-family HTH domain
MNPVSYARYLSSISTSRLAKELGVSRQYLSRLEQGIYDSVNKETLNWTVRTLNKHLDSPLSHGAVEQLYKEWQWQKRESCRMNKHLLPVEVTDFDRARQPEIIYYHKIFLQWRQDYWISCHEFCVDMCLHPDPVAKYEEGDTVKMPSGLKEVMGHLGLLGSGFKTSER